MFWVGAAVSVVGVYFVAGRHPAEGGGSTLHGDLLMVVAAFAWAAYTIGSAGLIARYSVLYVTGMTMAIGSGINVLILMPTILSVPWTSVSAIVWWLLVPSALVAGYLAFVVWFAAMHVIGAARTTVYANVVPIAAMVSAAIWLGESITAARAVGALAVLGGVALTRVGPHQPAAAVTSRR
jgi:drug/metabolite transporter (DMT)-like permease